MPRFRIGADGTVYDSIDLDRMQLTDILLLERQSAAMGAPVTWQEVQLWSAQMNALPTQAEKLMHPKGVYITAVYIWAARRAAGEDVDFGTAIDFPIGDLEFLPEIKQPQDHKPPDPTKAKSRNGGGGVAKGRKRSPATKSTSRATSPAASGPGS